MNETQPETINQEPSSRRRKHLVSAAVFLGIVLSGLVIGFQLGGRTSSPAETQQILGNTETVSTVRPVSLFIEETIRPETILVDRIAEVTLFNDSNDTVEVTITDSENQDNSQTQSIEARSSIVIEVTRTSTVAATRNGEDIGVSEVILPISTQPEPATMAQ